MSKKHYADRNLKFETLQLHVGQETPDPVTDARAVPIYLTSSYVFHNSEHAADRFGLRDAGNIYGRLTNPTEDVFERRIAALEGGVAALAVGSGAAALTYAFQAVAHAGDHIVAAKNIYGGTYNLLAHTLPDYGIEATFVDPFDYDGIKAAIKENTKAIEIETLGNPNSEVVDIEKIANIAHEAGIPLIVDNTFATPYLVRPIEYGADIVVHSATKFIGGHGTTIGGVIIDSGKFDWTQNDKWPWLVEPNVSYHGVSFAKDCAPATFATYIRAILLRDTGATISPVHSFIFLQGLETLSLRVERHVENALKVVQYLKDQPLVEKVNHPSISTNEEQHCKSLNGIAGQFKTGIFPLTIWMCYVKVLVSKIITACETDLTVNYGNFSVITVIHEHIKCKLNRIEYAAVNTIGTHFFDEILVKEEDTSYIIIE